MLFLWFIKRLKKHEEYGTLKNLSNTDTGTQQWNKRRASTVTWTPAGHDDSYTKATQAAQGLHDTARPAWKTQLSTAQGANQGKLQTLRCGFFA